MLPLDLHAHVQPGIEPNELLALRSCVAAVTRSIDEFDATAARRDSSVIWGVGCHPGLSRAVTGFSIERLKSAIMRTPLVGEIGLDRASRVPFDDQRAAFLAILRALVESPRMMSIHSYGATADVVAALEAERPLGVILHWWLGDESETRAAIELGAYFSINASQAKRWSALELVPASRVLLETDHPFGDKSERAPRRPGNLIAAETHVARRLGIQPAELRLQAWKNLKTMVDQLDLFDMLPRDFQVQLIAA